MRGLIRSAISGGAVVAVCTLGACGESGGPDAAPSSSASSTAGQGGASTAEITVEPSESIDGAGTWESDGVALEVPAGMKKERQESDGVVTLLVYEPNAQIDALSVVVGGNSSGSNTEQSVDDQVHVTQTSFASGGVTGMSIDPVQWSPWPYATALRGKVEQDGVRKDIWSVQALAPDSSFTVSVGLKAPVGELEESWQYEVLRTVRPA